MKSMIDTYIKEIDTWLDNNPNYMDDENKQNYFIQATRCLGQKCDTIDTKVIKKICFNTYIKDG